MRAARRLRGRIWGASVLSGLLPKPRVCLIASPEAIRGHLISHGPPGEVVRHDPGTASRARVICAASPAVLLLLCKVHPREGVGRAWLRGGVSALLGLPDALYRLVSMSWFLPKCPPG